MTNLETNSGMNADLCRQQLQRLLQEEGNVLTTLQGLLDREHGFITSDDLEALDAASREREGSINTLARIDQERQSLCKRTGYSADKEGVWALLKWCDPSGSLELRWQHSTTHIQRCRDLNDRNGALVNNRMKRVELLLNALDGQQASDSRTYSARGNAWQQNSNSGRVCNIQV